MTPQAISWQQARTIAGDIQPLPPVLTGVDHALGLVLASDVTAPAGLPAADTAAMDGFAVRGPGPWRVVGTLQAGEVRAAAISPGEAVEIATGAAVPPGAHTVLRYERALCSPAGEVAGRPGPGRHIRRAGFVS